MNADLPRPGDGCGKCIALERSVTVQPYLVRADGPASIRAYYRCGNCGHQWWTSWSARYLEARQSAGGAA